MILLQSFIYRLNRMPNGDLPQKKPKHVKKSGLLGIGLVQPLIKISSHQFHKKEIIYIHYHDRQLGGFWLVDSTLYSEFCTKQSRTLGFGYHLICLSCVRRLELKLLVTSKIINLLLSTIVAMALGPVSLFYFLCYHYCQN